MTMNDVFQAVPRDWLVIGGFLAGLWWSARSRTAQGKRIGAIAAQLVQLRTAMKLPPPPPEGSNGE
jgi:hypothetical protein